jgi:50S ribosomal protein L16 3-hydroxylase
MFELAGQEGVESRLVSLGQRGWRCSAGPFARRALPPSSRPRWTLLVQGVDLHVDAAHALLQQFAFVPAGPARRPDGQLGQRRRRRRAALRQLRRVPAAGRGPRRWRIGRQKDLSLQRRRAAEDPRPLRARGRPGARAGRHAVPAAALRARRHRGRRVPDLLDRLSRAGAGRAGARAAASAWPTTPATSRARRSTAIRRSRPWPTRAAFRPTCAVRRRRAAARAARSAGARPRAGRILTEPKANVWFDAAPAPRRLRGVVLDAARACCTTTATSSSTARAGARRERCEADAPAGRPRRLDGAELERASAGARELLVAWCEAGWAHGGDTT